jgi:hypothetical protein
MTKRTPEPGYVKLFLPVVESAAWRSLSINARRLLDFLIIEQIRHAGKANGALQAPYSQLVKFGITRRLIGRAIEEAERAGFVECRRGFGRAPSGYALTWLPYGDGSEASNLWYFNGLGSRKPAVEVSEREPLRAVPEEEPHRFPKRNHKARSGSRRGTTKPQIDRFPKRNPYIDKHLHTTEAFSSVPSPLGDDRPSDPPIATVGKPGLAAAATFPQTPVMPDLPK